MFLRVWHVAVTAVPALQVPPCSVDVSLPFDLKELKASVSEALSILGPRFILNFPKYVFPNLSFPF